LFVWTTIVLHTVVMSFVTVNLVMNQGKPIVWLGHEVIRLNSTDYNTNIGYWWSGFAVIAAICAFCSLIVTTLYWAHGRWTVHADGHYREEVAA
jgi:hypothetical protein